MKMIIDLPDWCEERHIYIMAGIECAAWKPYGTDKVFVKTERCNQCGECCKNLPKTKVRPTDDNGTCIYLEKQGEKYNCSLGGYRQFICSFSDPIQNNGIDKDKCSIKYQINGGVIK